MTTETWAFDASDGGQLAVRTDVTGRASKMGHRLTIAVTSWTATVEWSGDAPTAVSLTAEVGSLEVIHGEGGLTPLIGPEKIVAKANALKTFDANRYPTIRFRSEEITAVASGYRLAGTVEIHGVSKEITVDVDVTDSGDRWQIGSETTVRQTDYKITPYSQMFGAMKVADDVTVTFDAEYLKP
ncbi:S-adenosyl-L-methionine-dependent methyltransferase [Rhodococcoides fascians]|uniref:YceI family protein n=1 Tax=Rhodococcoides fascians TaxID=1828 RepID=UPI000B9C3382|nr:YceI family protein [Rhodococcus fascians]OZE89795.1 S-adenosyl-L-methionine-dependent methyltransferase [Rhodococcus fascians]OZF18102.1 S-adenosyl-L-methionine-dependent methyltransferase [Rhodococcus fascians]OZF21553.1 S-adenosyl-L-methionine-dependent methyltransferase [Rhodococcus fascians]OZF67177.1 S-adenosyl-L-methionine-dependent methyltransferase [Rhodococcus fascians]OZF70364.1 S-adenosyl-L-methionine-dependent methyltransferase [Rhodococcus fascians]